VFNPKISGVAASVAFILSFLIGIISKSGFPGLILRPLMFSIFFFIFSGLVFVLIGRFLPELMDEGPATPELIIPGSRIDITEDSPIAVPNIAFANPDQSTEEIGDISQIANPPGTKLPGAQIDPFAPGADQTAPDIDQMIPGMDRTIPGMDHTGQNIYTEGQEPLSSSGSRETVNDLADLESLIGAFIPAEKDEEEEVDEFSSAEPVKRSVGNIAQKMDMDFNPKELAAGIRTVLKKEEG
jgi:hypothetical protein